MRSTGGNDNWRTPAYEKDGIAIYYADCRDVLPLLGPVDHVITDPPCSDRTHTGHDASTHGHNDPRKDNAIRQVLGYEAWDTTDINVIIPPLCRLASGWVVIMTDHVLAPKIEATMQAADRYVFAPLPFVAPGSRCRLSGDGPSSWTTWIVVARTAQQSKWGTLPGAYIAEEGWRERMHMGGKPLKLMQALIEDYTRPGDLILDPFMGSGTTLRAAKDLGRRAIGIEREAKYVEIAIKRMAQGCLFHPAAAPVAKPLDLRVTQEVVR